jgi:hypothetical protein
MTAAMISRMDRSFVELNIIMIGNKLRNVQERPHPGFGRGSDFIGTVEL